MAIITAAGLSDLHNQRTFNKNGSVVTLKKISETDWLLFGDVAEGDSEGFGGGSDSGEWEGGLGIADGGQGWYKFATAPVEMGGLFDPHDISVSSTLNPEYSVQSVKGVAEMYVEILGWEEAYQTILSSITDTYTATHTNIVRPHITLPHPTDFIEGQPDEGAESFWAVYSDLTSGITNYLYGADQGQYYIKVDNPEMGYVPAPVEFDTFQKQIAFAFTSCEGLTCPESYSINWSLEMVVEINYPAIMDWIMPPKEGGGDE